MNKKRIEIIAVGKDKIYSVGAVEISPNGDVYVIQKILDTDFHTSRHSSGETHSKSGNDIITKIREGIPIKDFRGIEFLGTRGFGLESLPILHKEYRMEKCNGIFAFDMRDYAESAFNMTISILTEDGLLKLYESWKNLGKRQIFIFTDCHPMIAIMIADAKGLQQAQEGVKA